MFDNRIGDSSKFVQLGPLHQWGNCWLDEIDQFISVLLAGMLHHFRIQSPLLIFTVCAIVPDMFLYFRQDLRQCYFSLFLLKFVARLVNWSVLMISMRKLRVFKVTRLGCCRVRRQILCVLEQVALAVAHVLVSFSCRQFFRVLLKVFATILFVLRVFLWRKLIRSWVYVFFCVTVRSKRSGNHRDDCWLALWWWFECWFLIRMRNWDWRHVQHKRLKFFY